MDELLAAVKRVTDIMGEIAAASTEQLSGIEQVSAAVAQMDQVVQQNAAAVEQAAAATDSMATQAQSMAQVLSRFRTGQATGALASEPRTASAQRAVERAPAAKPLEHRAARLKRPPKEAPRFDPAAAADKRDEGEWKEI
jgi:methyl-accepting chemotaxis protein